MKRTSPSTEENIAKVPLAEQLHAAPGGALAGYRRKVLGGSAGAMGFVRYELANLFCMNLGGGLGYWVRKKMLSPLFRSCGSDPIFGRGLTVRKPGHIRLGDHVAIDDHTMLDAGSEDGTAVRIGDRVVISRGCLIQAKNRPLEMGDSCDIGAHSIVASAGGIVLERAVLVAANCYIGGARYHTEKKETPILLQGIYTRGPIRIGEGSWIGASATVVDGVSVGKGCVVGAGSVVIDDLPDYAVAAGVPARVLRFRE